MEYWPEKVVVAARLSTCRTCKYHHAVLSVLFFIHVPLPDKKAESAPTARPRSCLKKVPALPKGDVTRAPPSNGTGSAPRKPVTAGQSQCRVSTGRQVSGFSRCLRVMLTQTRKMDALISLPVGLCLVVLCLRGDVTTTRHSLIPALFIRLTLRTVLRHSSATHV